MRGDRRRSKGKFVLYLLFAAAVFAAQFLRTSGLATGRPPAIAKTTLGGIPAEALVGRGPALLYFWSDWCGVCATMQSSIAALAGDYPLLTVALRSGSDSDVNRYLRQKRLTWPVINDGDGGIAQSFGVQAVPALFFIAPEGDIVFTSVGYTSEWGLRIRLWLASLV